MDLLGLYVKRGTRPRRPLVQGRRRNEAAEPDRCDLKGHTPRPELTALKTPTVRTYGLPDRPRRLAEQHQDQRDADDHERNGRQHAGQRANLWPKHRFFSSSTPIACSDTYWAMERPWGNTILPLLSRILNRTLVPLEFSRSRFGAPSRRQSAPEPLDRRPAGASRDPLKLP
jgi:hypothetical protein